MEEIRKQIEDIICECDLDSDIDDELLDKIIGKLTAYYADEDDKFYMILARMDEMNKQLREIAMCFHEQVHGVG